MIPLHAKSQDCRVVLPSTPAFLEIQNPKNEE